MLDPARTVETAPRESYRDELNFAEFPLASLTTTIPRGQKTLEFTDEIFDKARNERVTRKLTITASDKFGLPTAIDDEVILGLIQLTAQRDFADRRVHFSRYELLRLLNWSDESRSYKRVEQSLKRWLGVTLYYDKAWWSKEEQSWVSEGFHILDHVQILDRQRQRKGAAREGEQAGKCSFVWNELVFNSFKAGYLKQLDFDFYKRLDSAVSKRMYRFLDKRFYHRQQLQFDLRTFACEHIGMSKKYHSGELKRALAPAIKELEEQGFLKAIPPEERFTRRGRGEWAVTFQRENAKQSPDVEVPELVKALIERGISRSSARTLAATSDEAKIREKIEFFDWLRARNDPRVQKRPAGFLYRAITEDYALPEDYVAGRTNRNERPEGKVIPIRKAEAPQARPQAESAERKAIDEFWASLPQDERERIEEEIVKSAPTFLRQQYIEGRQEKGLLFQVVRQAIIDDYVRGVLKAQVA